MIKIGDTINYGFYFNVKVVGEDDLHFILEDKAGNTKKIFKSLIHRQAQIVDEILF